MPIKWMMIILLVALVSTTISVIIDKAEIDSSPLLSGTTTSVFDKLFGGTKTATANLPWGTVKEINIAGDFYSGIFDLVGCNYSFYKDAGPIVMLFKYAFMIINLSVFVAMGAALWRGVASS